MIPLHGYPSHRVIILYNAECFFLESYKEIFQSDDKK